MKRLIEQIESLDPELARIARLIEAAGPTAPSPLRMRQLRARLIARHEAGLGERLARGVRHAAAAVALTAVMTLATHGGRPVQHRSPSGGDEAGTATPVAARDGGRTEQTAAKSGRLDSTSRNGPDGLPYERPAARAPARGDGSAAEMNAGDATARRPETSPPDMVRPAAGRGAHAGAGTSTTMAANGGGRPPAPAGAANLASNGGEPRGTARAGEPVESTSPGGESTPLEVQNPGRMVVDQRPPGSMEPPPTSPERFQNGDAVRRDPPVMFAMLDPGGRARVTLDPAAAVTREARSQVLVQLADTEISVDRSDDGTIVRLNQPGLPPRVGFVPDDHAPEALFDLDGDERYDVRVTYSWSDDPAVLQIEVFFDADGRWRSIPVRTIPASGMEGDMQDVPST